MKKFKAFTLVETLIVIVVFCIGILAVLQWLSQTLRNKDYANTQIKAAFFAREWIELVFNLRDANYHKELPWNCIFQWSESLKDDWNWCTENLVPGTILKIWMWSGENYIDVKTSELSDNFEQNLSWFQIYLHTWSFVDWVTTWYYYNHEFSENNDTGFARYLIIKWINWVDDNDKLLKIESHVLYKRGYLTWEKIMETFIWNYEFNQ